MCESTKIDVEREHARKIEVTVESLVARFYTLGKAAAKQVILQGRTVALAKTQLTNTEYQEFCRQVGWHPKSSTCRKFQKIGTEADWLLPIAGRLPANWTTIYDVARLGQAKAEELIRLGILHHEAPAKVLKASTIAEAPDATPETIGAHETFAGTGRCVFQIDASDLCDQERLNLYHDLENASAGFALAVTRLPDRLAEKRIIDREAA